MILEVDDMVGHRQSLSLMLTTGALPRMPPIHEGSDTYGQPVSTLASCASV